MIFLADVMVYTISFAKCIPNQNAEMTSDTDINGVKTY